MVSSTVRGSTKKVRNERTRRLFLRGSDARKKGSGEGKTRYLSVHLYQKSSQATDGTQRSLATYQTQWSKTESKLPNHFVNRNTKTYLTSCPPRLRYRQLQLCYFFLSQKPPDSKIHNKKRINESRVMPWPREIAIYFYIKNDADVVFIKIGSMTPLSISAISHSFEFILTRPLEQIALYTLILIPVTISIYLFISNSVSVNRTSFKTYSVAWFRWQGISSKEPTDSPTFTSDGEVKTTTCSTGKTWGVFTRTLGVWQKYMGRIK